MQQLEVGASGYPHSCARKQIQGIEETRGRCAAHILQTNLTKVRDTLYSGGSIIPYRNTLLGPCPFSFPPTHLEKKIVMLVWDDITCCKGILCTMDVYGVAPKTTILYHRKYYHLLPCARFWAMLNIRPVRGFDVLCHSVIWKLVWMW